jgi:AraC-like DNA-binding protein
VIAYKLQHPDESLTHAAFEFGYFDQSHFIKDMKKATGMTPSNFLAQENLFAAQLNLGA